jgi:hypothetical protein
VNERSSRSRRSSRWFDDADIVAAMLRTMIVVALVGCSGSRPASRVPADPQSVFWNDLRALCGRAFDGAIAVDQGAGNAPDPFTGKMLRMHVRECTEREIRVPFHVGDDRSRTWVFTRLPSGLRLAHDHRHEDGTADVLTMYGGDTVDPGTPAGQRFPANAYSRDLFTRENRLVSVPNVWIVAVVPGRRFSYTLTRPGRELRIDFDLTRPVPAPPPPWAQE